MTEYELNEEEILKIITARNLRKKYEETMKEIETGIAKKIGATFAYKPTYAGEQFDYSLLLYKNDFKMGPSQVSETYQEQQANMVRVQVTREGRIIVERA